jgi:hypothetical protein
VHRLAQPGLARVARGEGKVGFAQRRGGGREIVVRQASAGHGLVDEGKRSRARLLSCAARDSVM